MVGLIIPVPVLNGCTARMVHAGTADEAIMAIRFGSRVNGRIDETVSSGRTDVKITRVTPLMKESTLLFQSIPRGNLLK